MKSRVGWLPALPPTVCAKGWRSAPRTIHRGCCDVFLIWLLNGVSCPARLRSRYYRANVAAKRVITPEEEAGYLAATSEPLASIAVVLADTGIRPEECFRLRWENVTWSSGRNGVLLVTRGKMAAARRMIPMTARVRLVVETRWDAAGKPEEGWVWPAATRSGHVEPSSVRKQHANAFAAIAKEAAKRNEKPVRSFVLYSLRHTFLTHLGQSGCDVWTLPRIAGHSSISTSARYVHPLEDAVLAAVERLGGHKIGHNQSEGPQLPVATGKIRAVN